MKKLKKPLICLVFSVLIFVVTFTTRFALPGDFISLGDAFVLLGACFLPTGYAALAALIGNGAAVLIVGAPSQLLTITLTRVLCACWFYDSGARILGKRTVIGVVASAFLLIGGSYLSQMAQLQTPAIPLATLLIYAVAAAANIALFFVLAFVCDLLKLRPRLNGQER